MKNLKTVLKFAVAATICAVAAFTLMAAEPNYTGRVIVSYMGTLTNLAGATATNILANMDVSGQKTVAVSLTQGASPGSTTDNIIYFFQRSVDGVNWDGRSGWEEGQAVSFALTTFTKTTVTNLDTYGCGFMRLAWITNAGASTTCLTNLQVSYGIKYFIP